MFLLKSAATCREATIEWQFSEICKGKDIETKNNYGVQDIGEIKESRSISAKQKPTTSKKIKVGVHTHIYVYVCAIQYT